MRVRVLFFFRLFWPLGVEKNFNSIVPFGDGTYNLCPSMFLKSNFFLPSEPPLRTTTSDMVKGVVVDTMTYYCPVISVSWHSESGINSFSEVPLDFYCPFWFCSCGSLLRSETIHVDIVDRLCYIEDRSSCNLECVFQINEVKED